MEQSVTRPQYLGGTLSVPGDKSVSHRSLILNSIARGTAEVSGLSDGADVLSTMGCLRAMGVQIEAGDTPGSFTVHGTDHGLQEPDAFLDAGNSGTSMRLLSGLIAPQPFMSVLTGDSSLRTRPMGRVVHPLKQMGAQIMGRGDDTLAPLAIRGGSLQGIEYTMPVASAQVKSCIMLAGVAATGDTILHQPALSRDHTERMLAAMGASVETDGLALVLHPASLEAVDVAVPGDISAAAFWIVAGLCHPNARILVQGVGLNPSRAGIIGALKEMGAGDGLTLVNERVEGGEPVADLLVTSTDLSAIELGGDSIPILQDEIPVLAVAACFASGTTVIRDAQELRVKESDRIDTTVTELARLGANIEAREDGMVIHGTGRLSGGPCRSHGDHRLAMSLGIAGLLAEGETEVHGAEDVGVSYHDFWEHLSHICDNEGPDSQRS
jgi:3-phosphoshikimate 1-carboxyvinyltransferase